MTVAQGTPRLEELREHFREENSTASEVCFRLDDLCDRLERENAALSAQVAELQKDAERYKFLRTDRHILMGMAFYTSEELDTAIDKAMTPNSETGVPPSVKDSGT